MPTRLTRPNLGSLLGQPTVAAPRGPKRRFDPATASERHREQARRGGIAVRLANIAMHRLHPDDWRDLLAQANALVADELGPLPGD